MWRELRLSQLKKGRWGRIGGRKFSKVADRGLLKFASRKIQEGRRSHICRGHRSHICRGRRFLQVTRSWSRVPCQKLDDATQRLGRRSHICQGRRLQMAQDWVARKPNGREDENPRKPKGQDLYYKYSFGSL